MKTDTRTSGFIKKAVAVHDGTYDYTNVVYTHSQTKVCIVCSVHGEFQQTPNVHLSGKGCYQCGRDATGNKSKKSLDVFVKEAKKVHGDKYDYTNSVYSGSGGDIAIHCNACNRDFEQRAYRHISGMGCQVCANRKVAANRKVSKEEFLRRCIEKHGTLFDYTNIDFVSMGTPITLYCKNHGDFVILPSTHMNGAGCKSCGLHVAFMHSLETCLEMFRDVHKDTYIYDKVQYDGNRTHVTVTCRKHGDFLIAPGNHKGGQGCPTCGVNISHGETAIQDWITSLGVQAEKLRKHSIIGNYEVDVYLPEHKLGIEYNGLYWHNSRTKEQNYHLNKTKLCEEAGIHLMHFWDYEWVTKQPIVKSIIKNALGMHDSRVFARKTKVDKNVPVDEARSFCENNHLHGFRGGVHYIGLRYAKRLVALMITASTGEMVRFVIKCNTSVIGGFSRLLKYSPVTYSFVDRRVFTGTGYLANGFTLERKTSPNYFYVVGGDYAGSRQQFQKHKLSAKLCQFNPNETEVQNMLTNGYHQVFDCGNFVMQRGD